MFDGYDYGELVDKWNLKGIITEEEYEKLEDNLNNDYNKYPLIFYSVDYKAYLLYLEISRLMDIYIKKDWNDEYKPSQQELIDYNNKIKDIKDFLESLYNWALKNNEAGYHKIYKAIKESGEYSEWVMLQLFQNFINHLWN